MSHAAETTAANALSVPELAARLRSGELSSRALVEAALGRIAATEPTLHAHVVVLGDAARAEAARADAELAAGRDRGPLHGIPVGVKDIVDLAGVPTRCGSRVRDDAPPASADAPVVAALRAAGAIPVAKTVTQEFAAGVVSAPARNPWDPARIPGGSSGGSAAGIAAGCYRVALGSDTGGSIRIPAAACGVVGLKPTYGLVSKRGVFPLSWALDTVGPLAASVGDAALALDVLAGHDPADPSSLASPADRPAATARLDGGVRGLRLGVPGGFFAERVAADVLAAFAAALDVFRALGAEVVATPWAEAAAARLAAMVINRVESAAVHEATLRERADRYGPELRTRLAATAHLPATDYLRALRARVSVRESVAALFAAHRLDALLAPTLPATAVRADDLVIRRADGDAEPVGMAYLRLTQPFNATGQPVLSVPCGFDRDRLPVGLQIAGRPWDEAAVCRIGRAYEAATEWHRRRPPI